MSDHTKVIQMGRRGGKTRALVEEAKRDPTAMIVCATRDECERLHREYDVPREQLVTAASSRDLLRGADRSVYVDNADWVLRMMLGGDHIAACTFTSADPPDPRRA